MQIKHQTSQDDKNGLTFTSSTTQKGDVFDKNLVFTMKRKEQKRENPQAQSSKFALETM